MKTSSFFKILTLGLVSSITLMASPDVGAQADCPSCRPVECRDQDGNTVAESFCNPATKPSTTGTVIAGSIAWCPAGPTYSRTGTWGTCQAILSCQTFIPSLTNEQTCSALTVATCASQPVCMMQSYGAGIQTRDNICVSSTGATVADSNCGAEPPTSQTCDGYARYASERGVCTNGTQTRTLTCKDTNGNTVADTLCPQPEPDSTQACIEGEVCQPKLFPVRKVDRQGSLLEWQPYDVYRTYGTDGLISTGEGGLLTNRLNSIIANHIVYFNALGYNSDTYGNCMDENAQYGPEVQAQNCDQYNTTVNEPQQAIRQHERNFDDKDYNTVYTIYGTGRYAITVGDTTSSYISIPGETATGPGRIVNSILPVSSHNAMVITNLNDPYSKRAPVVYTYQTSAPWVGNYPSGDPQCTTRATQGICTQSERCSRVPDGAVCGTSPLPWSNSLNNTTVQNQLCSYGALDLNSDNWNTMNGYTDEPREWSCIDPNGGSTAYCCADGTIAGRCTQYGY